MKEARADPHLRAAHAAQMAMVERAVTEGLAERVAQAALPADAQARQAAVQPSVTHEALDPQDASRTDP